MEMKVYIVFGEYVFNVGVKSIRVYMLALDITNDMIVWVYFKPINQNVFNKLVNGKLALDFFDFSFGLTNTSLVFNPR